MRFLKRCIQLMVLVSFLLTGFSLYLLHGYRNVGETKVQDFLSRQGSYEELTEAWRQLGFDVLRDMIATENKLASGKWQDWQEPSWVEDLSESQLAEWARQHLAEHFGPAEFQDGSLPEGQVGLDDPVTQTLLESPQLGEKVLGLAWRKSKNDQLFPHAIHPSGEPRSSKAVQEEDQTSAHNWSQQPPRREPDFLPLEKLQTLAQLR